ncbi:MAG: major capsid protein [Oscillospiraceae bacterium]|nr:major capsid protein [Oscillospiraceae bacterium]
MTIYDTLYMLAAIEELTPEPTWFKRRYFPADMAMDVFGTSKVLADYKEGNRKAAPFVLPRIGALPVGRSGFSTYELEPGNISISKPLTIDQLNQRGFGESIMTNINPEERARRFLMGDLSDLSARVSRTEERLACDVMLNNGCVMRHQTDNPEVYEDVQVQFYDGENNPALFTPAAGWEHSKDEHTPGNWYQDIIQMIKMLTRRGKPATELLVSNDVGNFLMEDPWIQYMMDNRRADYGAINPQELTEYVITLGRFNFGGRKLEIFVNDGTFEDHTGKEILFLEEGSAIVTAPNCGKGLYGAVTQKEMDNKWHTHAGTRVPNFVSTIVPPADETIVSSRPLLVPKTVSPWTAAKKVFA